MVKNYQSVSFFLHVWEKSCSVITLREFANDLRGPRWQVQVESYRRWVDTQMDKEAQEQKSKMNAIVVAGVCRGGHAVSQVKELSGLAAFDLDHTDGRTRELAKLFRTLPYVALAFVSISGNGLKVVVRVDAENAARYATAYQLVAHELTRLAGHPCDMKCTDLGRATFASYDPEAYYNPQPEVFPWREMAPVAETAVPAPSSVPTGNATPAPGFMPAMLDDFERNNPFVQGSRYDFILKLGRVVRYKGFSQAEMQEFLRCTTERYACGDFSPSEIEKTLLAGYQYADSRPLPEMTKSRVQGFKGSPLSSPGPTEEEEQEEVLLGKNKEIRRLAPCFPDEVFQHLPPLIAKGVAVAHDERERDMLLLGILSNLSACLPGVHVLYDQMYYSPHFYFVAVAHAGAGKGLLALAGMLPNAINAYYKKQDEARQKEYDTALCVWEAEQQAAHREKRVPDLALRPEEPVKHLLQISPNISKNKLIEVLEDNGRLGGIINATEIDMVSGAIQRDYGKHDDVLRAAFHHEVVSSDFKVNGRQVVAHEPHLACCFAGTPSQLPGFVSSLANGLYSRLSIYSGEGVWQWHPVAPDSAAPDFRTLFRRLSARLLEMHRFLSESPTEVVFTPGQWQMHTDYFSTRLAQVTSEHEDSPGAIVLRHGLIVSRIASILTALRKCEAAWQMKEYTCTDEDFRTAMQIVDVLLEHSLLLSTNLKNSDQPVRLLKPYFRLRPVLDKLVGNFTHSELLAEAERQGLPTSTAKRLLKKVVEAKLVVKEGDSYHKTSCHWSTGGQR